jgi:hypothetical protein
MFSCAGASCATQAMTAKRIVLEPDILVLQTSDMSSGKRVGGLQTLTPLEEDVDNATQSGMHSRRSFLNPKEELRTV